MIKSLRTKKKSLRYTNIIKRTKKTKKVSRKLIRKSFCVDSYTSSIHTNNEILVNLCIRK